MHKPSRPRTPRYWPRMKVRGAQRRQDAAWARDTVRLVEANREIINQFLETMKEDHAEQ